MPKRKERMAGYIRESDPSLADSTTIESQAKAVRLYGEKEHYDYDISRHEFKEAISAYTVAYMERPKLLEMLAAAKRHEFDVLVISEVRALSRRQVEVFVIYDTLQKYGVRLETVQEKFEDSAMGRLILSLRAAYAEIEREQSFLRMQRGKKDRLEIGKAPNGHNKAAYGYVFIDTEKEVKGAYEFNRKIIFVDEEGNEWSEYTVVIAIFGLLKQGISLRGVTNYLNDLGIPPPRKAIKGEPHWTHVCVRRIISNRIYLGEVWANRYKRVGKTVVDRPKEEWVRLPDAPAIIDRETFAQIDEQLAFHKQDSLRNNRHPIEEVGLLRSGYIFCGICGQRMHVIYNGGSPRYICRQKSGNNQGVLLTHRTQTRMPTIDALAYEKIVETLKHPSWVRARVAELREEVRPVVDKESVEKTLLAIKRSMQNLYTLAENATDDETIAGLTERMRSLEYQKRDAERMLFDFEEDEEERAEIEEEITKFETWADRVRPLLTNPDYEASYEEKRLACRILGIRVTVFPSLGDWPFRYRVDVTIPAILKKGNYSD